jgi:hypothetical protein
MKPYSQQLAKQFCCILLHEVHIPFLIDISRLKKLPVYPLIVKVYDTLPGLLFLIFFLHLLFIIIIICK